MLRGLPFTKLQGRWFMVRVEVHWKWFIVGHGGSVAQHVGALAGSGHGWPKRTVLRHHGAQATVLVLR